MNKQKLTISKVVNGGYGLGHLPDGRIALVELALPAEELIIRTTPGKSKGSFVTARPLEILRPSEHRVKPPCPYFGECGGCNMQHCDYTAQTTLKTEILQELLLRQSHPVLPATITKLLKPTIPSPAPYHYRQRIRLHVDEHGNLGFRKYKTHDIVRIDHCLVAAQEINTVLAGLQGSNSLTELSPHTTEIELMLDPASRQVTAVVHLQRKPRPADRQRAEALLADIPAISRIFYTGNEFPISLIAPAAADKSFIITYDKLCDMNKPATLSWEVGGFCQVNLSQNRRLIEEATRLLSPEPHHTVLDLYCGSGNFSLPLATRAASLLGIEGQGAAIRSARSNSQLWGVANTEFIKKPVARACKSLVSDGRRFDLVICDPPRAGIPGLAADIARLCAHKLLYVSCDPATLCRDLAELHQAGLSVSSIQPLDMFPQTHHIETVVLLEKN